MRLKGKDHPLYQDIELPMLYSRKHMRKRAREKYIEQQQGICPHCNTLLVDEPTKQIEQLKTNPYGVLLLASPFFNWPIHLHHDHSTGLTVGAYHAACNAVLDVFHNQ